MNDKVTLSTRYKPALHFAQTAARWHERIRDAPPEQPAPDYAELTMLYSALSLEAQIAEALEDNSDRVQVDDLFERRFSVLYRWQEGARRISDGSAGATDAVAQIQRSCNGAGHFALLVRARNKFVHPRVYTEVFDDNGHAIDDRSIELLVQALRAAGLPEVRPAFPNILTCVGMATFARRTLAHMTHQLHRTLGKEVPPHWTEVLIQREM